MLRQWSNVEVRDSQTQRRDSNVGCEPAKQWTIEPELQAQECSNQIYMIV
jgi:hypothetical protein